MADGWVHLVDDDPGVRDALAFLLRSRGLTVRAFDGGAALLAALDVEGPPRGVFLLDVRMEPMTGTRLHDELLLRGLKNPVLFLTGHGDIPMVVEALKKGAFDFLEKPYSDNALADRIEQALAVDAAMQAEGAQAAERDARLASLTEREREVMTGGGRQAQQGHRRRAQCVGAHGGGAPRARVRQARRALGRRGGDAAGGPLGVKLQ